MTFAELRDLLERVKVGGALPIRFRVTLAEYLGAIRVLATLGPIPCRSGGGTTMVNTAEMLDEVVASWLTREGAVNLAYRLAQRAYLHELDEWFEVEGRVTCDPHLDAHSPCRRCAGHVVSVEEDIISGRVAKCSSGCEMRSGECE